MYIKESTIHGKGLFSDKYYQPNELIFLNGDIYKDGTYNTAWVNHSCIPSCYIKIHETNKVSHEFRAGVNGLKDGDEITVDYRLSNARREWSEKIEGHCNCEKCKEVK